MSVVDLSLSMLTAVSEWGRCRWLALYLVITLCSCGSQTVKSGVDSGVIDARGSELEMAAPPPAKPSKGDLVATLLAQGQRALSLDRLTMPENDNAFDRFSAVLLMAPEHEQARAGLDAIFFAYADRLREAIAIGKLKRAQRELDLLRRYFPEHPRLADLAATLTDAYTKAEQRRSVPSEPLEEGVEVVDLDESAVTQKAESVVLQLQSLATRVQAEDFKILIFARSDAEGRWIYKVMKDYLGDYRIRGDIRLSKRTAVQLKPVMY